ncbi:MAG: hypothetical protein ACLP3C_08400 [Mycobacterium sp.]|uniref:hypothetical protein n=1 Tax=Mycobacterium sp. TaxID=1785 RepID=UPI003F99FE67
MAAAAPRVRLPRPVALPLLRPTTLSPSTGSSPDDHRLPAPPRRSCQRGKQIAESGKYAPPRGEYLGRIESWGRLDVYEGSREEWIEALRAEQDS